MKTGFVWHEQYMWHDTGHYAGVLEADPAAFLEPDEHHENPRTKRRIKNLLDATGYINQLESITPIAASDEQILRVHTKDYFDKVVAMSTERGGDAGGLTPFTKGGVDIAKLSAGGALSMLQALMKGDIDNGYVLNRPPGHHAVADSGMGFCLFNNGAITARAAQTEYGLKRIAIVDWDVHHGNGAQSIFWNDPSVLTISVHQDGCFPPDSGHLHDVGEGDGKGYNLNIPLPPGSGRGAYLETFNKVVVPALRAYAPDLILVASGFDGSGFDPLGRNMMYAAAYQELTQILMQVADELCSGRIMMLHEGGYSPSVVPFCALRVIETLKGVKSNVDDPFEPLISAMAYQDLQPHQNEVILRAAANITLISEEYGNEFSLHTMRA